MSKKKRKRKNKSILERVFPKQSQKQTGYGAKEYVTRSGPGMFASRTAYKRFSFHERICEPVQVGLRGRLVRPLRMTMEAYLHYIFLRDWNDQGSEITAYGLCEDPSDPLLIHKLIVPRQACSIGSINIEEADLYDAFEPYMDQYDPWQYSSIWLHTHPGEGVIPSSVDWDEFFGHSPSIYFVMGILGTDGRTSVHMINAAGETASTVICPVIGEDTGLVDTLPWDDWAKEAEEKIIVDNTFGWKRNTERNHEDEKAWWSRLEEEEKLERLVTGKASWEDEEDLYKMSKGLYLPNGRRFLGPYYGGDHGFTDENN